MEKTINIADLMILLKKHFKLLLVFPFLFLAAGLIISIWFMPAKYSATSEVLVNQTKTIKQILDQQQQSNSQLVKTYTEVIKTSQILDEVSKELHYKYSSKDLSNMIKVNNKAGSELIDINVESKNKEDAVKIANTTALVFSSHAGIYMNIDGVSILTLANDSVKVSPNPIKIGVIAFFFGLIIEIIVLVLNVLLNNRIKDEQDVTSNLQLPFLGNIKSVKLRHKDKKYDFLGLDGTIAKEKEQLNIKKQLTQIQTALLVSQEVDSLNSVVFTSDQPNTGKSFVSAQTAIALAHAGFKTLLIDGHLEHPKQHINFDITNEKGLSNLISNQSKIKEEIINTSIKNLDLLPAGTTKSENFRLIAPNRLESILYQVEKEYDMLIIDAPSINEGVEAQLFAKLCHQVVLVLDTQNSQQKAVNSSKKLIQNTGANILGVILNKA